MNISSPLHSTTVRVSQTTHASNLETALAYARLGWTIFPLEPGSKRPHGNSADLEELRQRGRQRHTTHRLARSGFLCATSDETQVSEWWTMDPTAGIGWVPGPGHLVIDVDVKDGKQGAENLRELMAEHGDINSLTSCTPSGGAHIVLSTSTEVLREGTDVLGNGLDIRASRGYVVLPPTEINGKAYAWTSWNPLTGRPNIAPAPPWLVAELCRGRAESAGLLGMSATVAGYDDPLEFARQATADGIDESTVEELRSALQVIPSDIRGTWIAMGFALASLKTTDFSDDARDMWLEWSATSSKYDEREASARWRDFVPRRTGHGAVFAEAQRLGWKNPRLGISIGAMTAAQVMEHLRAMNPTEIIESWTYESKHLPSDAIEVVKSEVSRLTGVGVRKLEAALTEMRNADAQRRSSDSAAGRTRIRYRAEDKTVMAQEVEAAIVAQAQAGEYISFAGTLSEVATKWLPGTHLIDSEDEQPPAIPTIVPLDNVALLGRAERVAVFYTDTAKGERNIGVPPAVIDILEKMRPHAAPQVSGLVTHPIVLPSGEILVDDGIHESSRLFLHGAVLAEAKAYNQAEAKAAVIRLREVFLEGFEFADAWDCDVALAGLFTAVQRRVLDTAPGLVVKAHMQSSGKTTLVRRMHVILTGQDLPVSTFPKGDEAEVQKRLLSTLMRSPAIICFDNLPDGEMFSSASISGAMTSPIFTQRLLGVSRDVDVPTHSFFVLTGNNLSLGADEDSRWLVASLAPQVSRPSERTFRHPDVVSHALKIRAEVLRDVVGVIAGYIASGERMASATRFARWDSLVRQPLIWAGASDMSRNFANNAAMSEKGSALIEMLSVLHHRFGTAEFTSTQVANLFRGSYEWGMCGDHHMDDSLSRLHEALMALGAQQPAKPGSLGPVLTAVVGRVCSIKIDLDRLGSERDAALRHRKLGGTSQYRIEL